LLAFSKNFKRGPSGEEGLIRAWDTAWKINVEVQMLFRRSGHQAKKSRETDGAPRHEGPGLHAESLTQKAAGIFVSSWPARPGHRRFFPAVYSSDVDARHKAGHDELCGEALSHWLLFESDFNEGAMRRLEG
jgi:hypothetical protein